MFQTMVNANSAGTWYVLKKGIDRLQTITPKDGDVYQGETGTILSGAKLLTSFIREGVYWVATNQTQQGPSSTTVPCQTGREGCEYVEQLFFDDAPLQHVETLAQVAPGKWFFDYIADKIYFIDDPIGRKV